MFQNRGLTIIIRPAIKEESQDSSVGRVTRLWSRRMMSCGLIATRCKRFFFLHCIDTCFGAHPVFCLMDNGASFPEGKTIRATLITHFQLVQRFRLCGAIPALVHMPS